MRKRNEERERRKQEEERLIQEEMARLREEDDRRQKEREMRDKVFSCVGVIDVNIVYIYICSNQDERFKNVFFLYSFQLNYSCIFFLFENIFIKRTLQSDSSRKCPAEMRN